MIFDHLKERFFIQNKEISDIPNFRGMGTGTGDRGPGAGDRDQGPGPEPGTRSKSKVQPFDFSAISEFFEEMQKAKGGNL